MADARPAVFPVGFPATPGLEAAGVVDALGELARRAADGRLRVTVAATFPLDRAGVAQERSATGHTRGKLVLEP